MYTLWSKHGTIVQWQFHVCNTYYLSVTLQQSHSFARASLLLWPLNFSTLDLSGDWLDIEYEKKRWQLALCCFFKLVFFFLLRQTITLAIFLGHGLQMSTVWCCGIALIRISDPCGSMIFFCQLPHHMDFQLVWLVECVYILNNYVI